MASTVHSPKGILLRAILFAAVTGAPVFGGIEIGRGYLYGRMVTRVEADSNIYANAESNGDLVGTAVPEVGLRRTAGLLRIDLSAGAEVQRFMDHALLNAENPFAFASADWSPEQGKTEGRMTLSLRRLAQANPVVNQRTDAEDWTADGSFGHYPREKLGYRLRGSFSRQDYLTQGLSDVQKAQVGMDGRFRYSQKLEAFVGYTRRDSVTYHRSAQQPSIESHDDQGIIGLDGELFSKVRGQIKAGLVRRSFARGFAASEAGLLLDSEIEWQSRPNQSIAFRTKRDYDTSPADQTIHRSSFALDTVHRPTPKAEVALSLSQSDEKYRGAGLDRRDRSLSLQVRGMYSFSPRSSGSAALSFSSTRSSLALADYDRMIFTIAWALTF